MSKESPNLSQCGAAIQVRANHYPTGIYGLNVHKLLTRCTAAILLSLKLGSKLPPPFVLRCAPILMTNPHVIVSSGLHNLQQDCFYNTVASNNYAASNVIPEYANIRWTALSRRTR